MFSTPDQRFIKSDSIILRRSDYSETSLVMLLLTREYGTMSVLAKGARRPKHIFEGEIDLFARGQAVILLRPRGTLHILTEFSCRERYLGLRHSPARAAAAHYSAQAAADASPDQDPQPEIYDLLSHTLSRLEEGEIAPVLAYFQVHLLRLSGYMPDLGECTVCRSELEGESLTYSFSKAGPTCPKCRGEDDRAVSVSRGVISLITSLARKTAPARGRIYIPSPLALETVSFLGRLIAAAFERDPRILGPLLAALSKKPAVK